MYKTVKHLKLKYGNHVKFREMYKTLTM